MIRVSMSKITLLLYCIMLSALMVAAGNNYYSNEPDERLNDTVRLDEVIVTGAMSKINLRNLPMSISVISEKQIEERMQPSLLPLLAEEVPGLFITQRGVMGYGVSNGSAGGMSIRGIGGAPTAGVLVLIDGHPQYMGLMGHPLADSYQSMMTERVEIVRGPASVLYGSNAMGGVINLITKKQQQDGSYGTAQVMYGSYNTLNAEASSGWKKDRLNVAGNIGYNRSDGHRENMEFEQWNGYAKVGYDISGNWKSFADFNISNTESSNPGMVAIPMIDNDADITRGMTSLALENEYANTSGAVKLFYNFGTHRINDGYREGGQPLPQRFNSSDRMAGVSLYQSYSLVKGNKTTAGFDFQHFGGEAKNKFPDEADNKQLVDTTLYDIAGYLNIQQTILNNKLILNAGIRLDHHEINGSEWIPQLGASFTPSNATVLKAIVSKGFRNPTIREMYMFPSQNANLKPERLMNYEISLLQMLMDNRLSVGVNLFYINGDNMIQQVQPNVGQWDNIGEVENKGFEVSTTYQATPSLRFSANYSYLDMTYKILYAPEHKLHVGGNYNRGRWNLSSGVQYIGNMHTSPAESLQESFVLWNARASFKLTGNLDIFARGENLLGQKYEINAGYPMPGTTIFGGIRVRI